MFSNEKIIKWMKEDFIPVAINVNYLQSKKDREGLLFRKIAEQGHYAGRTKPTGTRQGFYIATIDGALLASGNNHSAIKVMQLMQKGLNGWKRGKKNQAGKFSSPAAKPAQDRSVAFPAGGLILRQAVRDLPRPDQPHHKTNKHNFDHVWMTAEEIKAFAPSKQKRGFSYAIPEKIVRRLIRWHLIDQVKGESTPWGKANIVDASINATVTQVKNLKPESRLVRIKLNGNAKCVAAASGKVNPYGNFKVDKERGIEAVIKGWLTYDTRTETFTEFDMLALGERWGATTYNFRQDDLERSPIGFAFKLLPAKPENKTKPAFAYEDYFGY